MLFVEIISVLCITEHKNSTVGATQYIQSVVILHE
jgi:hypothetical protein